MADPTPLTQEQIYAALAASLLPLAGKTGIAVASVVPALEGLIETFQNGGQTDYTVEQLVTIVMDGSAAYHKVLDDIAAMPDA